MTKTLKLLSLMIQSGKPMTYKEIMDGTGWTLVQAKKIVHYMASSGYITHLPLSYVITQSGLDQQHVDAKTPREAINKKTEQRRIRRKRERERVVPFSVAQKINDGETTVQSAMRTQPNSVFGLGAMPCTY